VEVEGISTTGDTQANRATGETKKGFYGGSVGTVETFFGARAQKLQRSPGETFPVFALAGPRGNIFSATFAEGPRWNIFIFGARGPPVEPFLGHQKVRGPPVELFHDFGGGLGGGALPILLV